MSKQKSGCKDGVKLRGRTYHLRIRVPERFAGVETRKEICSSLRTRDRDTAIVRAAIERKRLISDWEARLAHGGPIPTNDEFQASLKVLESWGLPYRSMANLVDGPITELVRRIAKIEEAGLQSALVPAALGTCDKPFIRISEMPTLMEKAKAAEIAAKNPNQKREWRNKYIHAAKSFKEIVGDKAVHEITEADALAYRNHWKRRHDQDEISTNHAVKRLRFLRQMIDEYFESLDVPMSQRINPMDGLTISKKPFYYESSGGTKVSLPPDWVASLVRGEIVACGNEEGQDIAVVSADNGTRQSEVYNVPPEDIHLDHEIPHLVIRTVTEGENTRQIKNQASTRIVPLLGGSLEAMKRHPEGFARYRGKGSYSGTINGYLHENNLFPEHPDGPEKRFSIGCTRHTYEDRLVAAGLNNEERAYLMGHSLQRIRGRPVYGSGPDLVLRALYQEMVAHETTHWKPRSHAVLRSEIERHLEEMGFRIR